jgi:hypothetical protein
MGNRTPKVHDQLVPISMDKPPHWIPPFLRLSTELYCHIASYLELHSQACLALSCRRAHTCLGTQSWQLLRRDPNSFNEQRILFLHLLKRDFDPLVWWLCFDCEKLHHARKNSQSLRIGEDRPHSWIHTLRNLCKPRRPYRPDDIVLSIKAKREGACTSPKYLVHDVLRQYRQAPNMLALRSLCRKITWYNPQWVWPDSFAQEGFPEQTDGPERVTTSYNTGSLGVLQAGRVAISQSYDYASSAETVIARHEICRHLVVCPTEGFGERIPFLYEEDEGVTIQEIRPTGSVDGHVAIDPRWLGSWRNLGCRLCDTGFLWERTESGGFYVLITQKFRIAGATRRERFRYGYLF